jgi:hypothetical protein
VKDMAAVPSGRQELPVDVAAAPPLYWPIAKVGGPALCAAGCPCHE